MVGPRFDDGGLVWEGGKSPAERLGGEEGGGEGREGVGIKVRVVRRRYEVEEEA